MIIGAVLQATSYTRAHMIVGRIVSGFGMGAINSTVPVLQAEFSPKASRGVCKFSIQFVSTSESRANWCQVVCAQLSTLNFGIFLVYWIDYGFSSSAGSHAWRVPVILQCIFLLGMLFILLIIPESPRWLAAHDRPDECLAVLQRLASRNEDGITVRQLHQTILQTVALEHSLHVGSWKDLLKNDHIKSQQRLLIACAIQTFQQLGGINAIICNLKLSRCFTITPLISIVDYSSTLFEESLGFDSHTSALMSGGLQTWFFVASFIPWFLIDRVGRRPLVSHIPSLPILSVTDVPKIVALHGQSNGHRHGCSGWTHTPSRA